MRENKGKRGKMTENNGDRKRQKRTKKKTEKKMEKDGKRWKSVCVCVCVCVYG